MMVKKKLSKGAYEKHVKAAGESEKVSLSESTEWSGCFKGGYLGCSPAFFLNSESEYYFICCDKPEEGKKLKEELESMNSKSDIEKLLSSLSDLEDPK